MKAKLFQQNGQLKGEIDLPQAAFGVDINEHLLHQVVKTYLSNERQGTAKTKGRSEVSGGGKKPWKQKGTGRARAGSNTSPIWVRGGKAHGPVPRDYYSAIPRKMRKLALASALTSRANDEKIIVIDSIACEEPKTKTIAGMLKSLSLNDKKNLLIITGDNTNVYLAARNIKNLQIRPVNELNALDILHSENIIFGGESLVVKMEEAVAL